MERYSLSRQNKLHTESEEKKLYRELYNMLSEWFEMFDDDEKDKDIFISKVTAQKYRLIRKFLNNHFLQDADLEKYINAFPNIWILKNWLIEIFCIFGFFSTPVAYDSKEYWGSNFVDNFVSRLKPQKITYMSGHDNIGTSNHKIIYDFINSMYNSLSTQYITGDYCYHNASCVTLNKTPNVQGFNQRRENGHRRGLDYVNQLKSDCVKGQDGLVHDTIDIVCHSMGFAHALGVIDVIKDAMKSDLKGLTLGRFYIIAPENACSGEVNVNDWEEVWQYGTDETNTPLWLQDGVAPQCRVKNLWEIDNKSGRAYIPSNAKQGFISSHLIENYGWIFTKLQTKDDPGYVTPRK